MELLFGRLGVGPEESDGGRVVVQLVQFHFKLADDVPGDGQCQRALIAGEQLVQTAAQAVVVERKDLLLGKPQQVGSMARCPIAHTVDRIPRDEDVLQ